MANNHYVPKLILRKFSDKLSLYNVRTGELKENISLDSAYALENYYDSEIEKKLNLRVESQFGGLLSNFILKCDKEISLNRKRLYLIKKFLLVSILRSKKSEELLQAERSYYDDYQLQRPFEEKQIDGETSFDYWMRTLNVVLDTDGTPQEILKHLEKTYPAYRWAKVVNDAHLGFWDSPKACDEFVITDIGMTSENEKGCDGVLIHNHKKLQNILSLLPIVSSEKEQKEIVRLAHATASFHENFEMFPISSRRMIVLISPFFRDRYRRKQMGEMVLPLNELTVMKNESLFEPNKAIYKIPQAYQQGMQYHEDDRYIYDVKILNNNEIQYCNALFLDRIDTYLGFSSLDRVKESILKYKKLNEFPSTPRVDYTELYKIIQKRYSES